MCSFFRLKVAENTYGKCDALHHDFLQFCHKSKLERQRSLQSVRFPSWRYWSRKQHFANQLLSLCEDLSLSDLLLDSQAWITDLPWILLSWSIIYSATVTWSTELHLWPPAASIFCAMFIALSSTLHPQGISRGGPFWHLRLKLVIVSVNYVLRNSPTPKSCCFFSLFSLSILV